MDIIKAILSNYTIWIALAAWGVAQIVKVIVNCIIEKKFDVGRLFGDGGMPSCHSSMVMALVVMSGYSEGFDSPVFAVAFIFAMIVMHDATGVRYETGKQAVSLKELADIINKSFASEDEKIRTENLKELVGHTPLQVFFGALTGIAVSVLAIIIFGL